MEKADAIALSLTDMVFEHRNKAYGAYQLRQAYDHYLQRATFAGCSAFLVLVAFLWYLFRYVPETDVFTLPSDGQTTVTRIEDRVEPPVPLPPPPTVRTPPPATIDFREMVVARDEEIDPNDNPTRVEETIKQAISNMTVDGPESVENAPLELSESTGGTGILDESPAKEQILITAEQMPEFPGGEKALLQYLSRQLHYPASARENGVSGKVYVQFVVNSQGKVKDVQVLKGIDSACDAEAVRAISQMPDWKPGRQNGRNVSVRFTTAVQFVLPAQ